MPRVTVLAMAESAELNEQGLPDIRGCIPGFSVRLRSRLPEPELRDKFRERPYLYPRPFMLAVLWHFEATALGQPWEALLTWCDPAGAPLDEMTIEFSSDHPADARFVAGDGILLTTDGTYEWRIQARQAGTDDWGPVLSVYPVEVALHIQESAADDERTAPAAQEAR